MELRAPSARLMPVLALLVTGCAGPAEQPPQPDGRPRIAVRSDAFAAGAALPRRFSCDGAGTSPPLSWTARPDADAAGYALVVDDPDAPGGTYVHWVVVDIPAAVRSVAADSRPRGGRETATSAGRPGYAPPCPPSGTHRYRFTVYALRHRLGLDAGTDPRRAVRAVVEAARAWGRLTATYRHPD